MKKFLFLTMLLVGCFLFAGVSHGESMQDWEWTVYYDVVETWHEMLYQHPRDWYPSNDDFERIYSQVGAKHGITSKEVSKIDSKAIWAKEITTRENEIADYLWKKLEKLSDYATADDARRAHRETADHFGISLSKLHEIEYRIEETFWGYYFY
jgi:hypothetical protein